MTWGISADAMVVIGLCFGLAAGCSKSAAPEFRLNSEGRDPRSISRIQAAAISDAAVRLFGTPDAPRRPDGVPLNLELLQTAAGAAGGDAAGNQWGLFRRYCAGCHGISGDGQGSAAAALDPYPRDFRDGVFKFTSTAGGAKPLKEDLLRTLRQGVRGTAMPSFRTLTDGQLEALVEYVKYLGIRGVTELYLMQQIVDEELPLPVDCKEVIEAAVLPAAKSWEEAAAMTVIAPKQPDADNGKRLGRSIARGRDLFSSADAQCAKCHGSAGDGHGQQVDLYDDWNRRKLGATDQETRRLADRFRLPLERLRPREFTLGVFHGGDRPLDQYWRICCGIKGTPMPAFGPSPTGPGALSPAEIWDLVNFVRSLKR
ncbi:MAG: cytochrome c [Planctomycetaceae bacterium]|nr:cytochrome c [Planctomycetaceae bacterium]